ncbi:cell wall hydrolase [Paenibacillus mesophilus]|uniref:cell wall hydrolase n=1 Tax=Paenibacillus mesophilus TaxID=2582849 RepID=UPI00110E0B87|nr:cell wall hydrolase [Paenibacillus mesophilus]TMV49467.1 cell wall hydrolase [Paenibacillus mesophilus]
MKKGSVLVIALGMIILSTQAGAISLEQGSRSEHVLDLQQRLSSLGYFKAGITGYYGSVTNTAVKKFQTKAGLPASGQADAHTLSALNEASAPDQTVLEQMARMIHAEARGESFLGQVAVGAVILNRVQSDAFPDSITEVIFQPGQFSAIRDGQFNLTPSPTAYEAAKAALNGSDPTNGALYYYNPKIATSSWSKKRPIKARIDRHVFTQ